MSCKERVKVKLNIGLTVHYILLFFISAGYIIRLMWDNGLGSIVDKALDMLSGGRGFNPSSR